MSFFKYKSKNVYYRVSGQGDPLILLHGNTVSSKLFSGIRKLYAKDFKLIMIDFPGHGKSDRLARFETDFWFENSLTVKALLDELKLEQVGVCGTSGGALVGINLALEFPEKVKWMIADSFEGEYPLDTWVHSLESDREGDKKKILAKLYWFMCHGFDWKWIVDLDTQMNMEFAKTGRSFFHKPISDLSVPTLLTGSMKDEYCDHLDQILNGLKDKNADLEVHLFESGSHPAMLSNKVEFYALMKQFSGRNLD